MQLFLKSFFTSFSFFLVLLLSAQQAIKQPSFIKQIFSNGFVSSKSYILIDKKQADFEKLLKMNDTSILKIELFDKKVAESIIGKKEGKYGLIMVTTKPYRPLKYPLVTTSDSAEYFVINMDTIFWREPISASIGGDTTYKSWSKFLEKNLNPIVAADHGASAGLYSVTVIFFVNKDGSVSNVEIVHDPGYGTAQEVQRIMSQSPVWEPAIYRGQKVRSLKKQIINFAVIEN